MPTQPLTRPNPSSGTPVYLQLVDQVRRRLESGALQPGEALPGVAPLAEALVLHPASVARAYRELETLRLAVRSGGVLRASCQPPAPAATPGAGGPPADGWPGLAGELEAARDVQRCLLPPPCPGMAGLDYAGRSRAARGVTGDYYHFAPLPGHRLAIAIGDVCGKGVPAALGMAALRAYLHGATARHQADPRALVTMVNDLVYASVPVGRFATLFYGVYHLEAHALEYVNAGHLPPVILRARAGDGRREHLTVSGPALGLMPGARYTAARVVLDAGDLLAAYTDGISDALNPAGDEWGDDRVLALLERSARCGARDIVETVLTAADEFARGASQHDDMTVTAVRVM